MTLTMKKLSSEKNTKIEKKKKKNGKGKREVRNVEHSRDQEFCLKNKEIELLYC